MRHREFNRSNITAYLIRNQEDYFGTFHMTSFSENDCHAMLFTAHFGQLQAGFLNEMAEFFNASWFILSGAEHHTVVFHR